MISFDKINQFDPVYQFFNWFFRIDHNYIYYKEIQVIGYENVPPKGYPVFAISNHSNSVMDPLALLYLYKDHRQPVFVARGDVFKKSEFIAKLLRFLKILPTFRSRDGGREDVRSNLDTFDLAARVLDEGGTLTMYPEAGHQAGRFFSTFKKGFPRIAFRAAEKADFQLDFKILPIYIYYSDFFNMRAKQVVVIGEPFAIDEFYDLYKAEPNKAFLAMNEKAREAVRRMGIDVVDQEHYPQYEVIFHACRSLILTDPHAFDGMEVAGTLADRDPKRPYAAMLSDKKVTALLEQLSTDDPEAYRQLMDETEEYRAGLYRLRLRDWLFERPVTGAAVLGRALLLLLTIPIFLVGAVGNLLPFKAPELLKRNLKDPMFKSTLNFVPSIVIFFPLWYIILFTVLCICATWWIGLLGIVAALLTLIPFYEWKKAFVKWCGMLRFRRYAREKLPTFERLKSLRAKIRGIVK